MRRLTGEEVEMKELYWGRGSDPPRPRVMAVVP